MESPGKQQDLSRTAFGFGGLDHRGDGFEVVLRPPTSVCAWSRIEKQTDRNHANHSIPPLLCCSQHLDGLVILRRGCHVA